MPTTAHLSPADALIRAHLESATPEHWHIYAARSSYDGNLEHLAWLVEQPTLDRGTALLIYWWLGAAWDVQYAREADAISPELYRVLRRIETLYPQHYTNAEFWFDPEHSIGGGPHDYPDLPVVKPIPDKMLLAVSGSCIVDVEEDPEGWDEGLPGEVVDALWALDDD